MLSIKDIEKRRHLLVKHSVRCKCTHSIAIPKYLDRVICKYCGEWCYRTAELEEKYKEEQKKKDFIKNMKGLIK